MRLGRSRSDGLRCSTSCLLADRLRRDPSPDSHRPNERRSEQQRADHRKTRLPPGSLKFSRGRAVPLHLGQRWNENSQLYLRERDGAERDLTPGEKTKANFLKWSEDRKLFFFWTNQRDPRFFDIVEMTLEEMKPQLIYKDETGFDFGDIQTPSASSPWQKSEMAFHQVRR